jgi:hypothetical protein
MKNLKRIETNLTSKWSLVILSHAVLVLACFVVLTAGL